MNELNFWGRAKVDQGCWVWQGPVTRDGYGRNPANWPYKGAEVHRVAYLLAKGPVPVGMHIDHLCRNRLCINPDHLEAVSPAENQRRGLWAMRSVCANGHAYTPANTYIRPNGRRDCRACFRERTRQYQRRKAAA